ncbi:MAG: tetratricopeptide repeat protein [Chitinophagales bacterium]
MKHNQLLSLLGVIALLFGFTLVSCDGSNSTTEDVVNTEGDSIVAPAVEYYDSLILKNPKDATLYYQRAMYYYEAGFVPAGLADTYSAIHLDSSAVEYYYLAADLHIEMGDGKNAIGLMSKAINQFPEDEELYLRATEYNYLMMYYEPALNFVNDLLEINPYNADAYFLKGLIYKEQGFNEKAMSTFQTCTEQDPTFYNAYMQLGLLHTDENSDFAISYFDNALRLLPESREAMYGKGFFYQKVERYNEAVAEYRTLIGVYPKDHVSFYNIGYCYLQMDSLEKSYNHFNIATQIQPQYAGAYYMKGFVAEQRGDVQTAIVNYEQAQLMMPDNEDVIDALARLQ